MDPYSIVVPRGPVIVVSILFSAPSFLANQGQVLMGLGQNLVYF